MPSVQYYVASSLDGFIATRDDDLAWLLQFDGFEGGKESYEAFISGIGCIAMGGTTYQWLMDHEPGNWPYPGTPCWVFTHHEFAAPSGADIAFVRGGDLAAQFAGAGLLDEMIVSVIPVVLGDGKRLLPVEGPTPPLELVESRTQGRGIVELRYRF